MSLFLHRSGLLGVQRKHFLADLVPGASFLWSPRQALSSDANTAADFLTVRETGSNTEDDFSAAQVNGSELTVFTGANDGRIVAGLDASGEGNHPVQATAAEQPWIVDSGTLLDGADFRGGQELTRAAIPALSTADSFSVVCLINNRVLEVSSFFAQRNGSNQDRFYLGFTAADEVGFRVQKTTTTYEVSSDTLPLGNYLVIATWNHATTTPSLRVNKVVQDGDSPVSMSPANGLHIGSRGGLAGAFDGHIFVAAAWPFLLSAEQISAVENFLMP